MLSRTSFLTVILIMEAPSLISVCAAALAVLMKPRNLRVPAAVLIAGAIVTISNQWFLWATAGAFEPIGRNNDCLCGPHQIWRVQIYLGTATALAGLTTALAGRGIGRLCAALASLTMTCYWWNTLKW